MMASRIAIAVALFCVATTVESAAVQFARVHEFSAEGCAASAKVSAKVEPLVICAPFGKTPKGETSYLTQKISGGKYHTMSYNMSGCTGAPYATHTANLTCAQEGNKWRTRELVLSSYMAQEVFSEAGCKGNLKTTSYSMLGMCNSEKKEIATCDGSKVTYTTYTDANCTQGAKKKADLPVGKCAYATAIFNIAACKTADGKTISAATTTTPSATKAGTTAGPTEVKGSFEVAVDAPSADAFIKDPNVKAAFAEGVSKTVGVDVKYVTVSLKKGSARRLQASANVPIIVDFTISVPASATASMKTAAAAASKKLKESSTVATLKTNTNDALAKKGAAYKVDVKKVSVGTHSTKDQKSETSEAVHPELQLAAAVLSVFSVISCA
eukprot:TRINITY_DN194_c0_g1_i5.p1 TRINITY_DN194_c0_g1~~TRINITY_DN194_c0_g1_i5.p1  ORF type:complete len:383 (+),score=88.58 TRINITY_DN194_c0_g1_i5:68-1216(+)